MRVLTWKIFYFLLSGNVLWEKLRTKFYSGRFLFCFFVCVFTRTVKNVTFILFLWEGKPSFNVEECFLLYRKRRSAMLPLFFSYGKEIRVLTWKNVFFFTKNNEEQCYPYSFLIRRRIEVYHGRMFFSLLKKTKNNVTLILFL